MEKKRKILDEESFDILGFLIDQRGLNFQRIIDDLGFNRNSTHRRLAHLIEVGLVKEEHRGRWKRGMKKNFLVTKKGESYLYQKYADDLNVVLVKIRRILEKIQEKPAIIQHYRDSASQIIEKSIDQNKPYNPPEKPPQGNEGGEWPGYIARWERHRMMQRKAFGSLVDSFRRMVELIIAASLTSEAGLLNKTVHALEKERAIRIELPSENIVIELDLANGSAEILGKYPGTPR